MQYVIDGWNKCEDRAWYFRLCAMENEIEKSYLVAIRTGSHKLRRGGRRREN